MLCNDLGELVLERAPEWPQLDGPRRILHVVDQIIYPGARQFALGIAGREQSLHLLLPFLIEALGRLREQSSDPVEGVILPMHSDGRES